MRAEIEIAEYSKEKGEKKEPENCVPQERSSSQQQQSTRRKLILLKFTRNSESWRD